MQVSSKSVTTVTTTVTLVMTADEANLLMHGIGSLVCKDQKISNQIYELYQDLYNEEVIRDAAPERVSTQATHLNILKK